MQDALYLAAWAGLAIGCTRWACSSISPKCCSIVPQTSPLPSKCPCYSANMHACTVVVDYHKSGCLTESAMLFCSLKRVSARSLFAASIAFSRAACIASPHLHMSMDQACEQQTNKPNRYIAILCSGGFNPEPCQFAGCTLTVCHVTLGRQHGGLLNQGVHLGGCRGQTPKVPA